MKSTKSKTAATISHETRKAGKRENDKNRHITQIKKRRNLINQKIRKSRTSGNHGNRQIWKIMKVTKTRNSWYPGFAENVQIQKCGNAGSWIIKWNLPLNVGMVLIPLAHSAGARREQEEHSPNIGGQISLNDILARFRFRNKLYSRGSGIASFPYRIHSFAGAWSVEILFHDAHVFTRPFWLYYTREM